MSSLNPFAEDLLRIERQPGVDGKSRVFGFLVRNAEDWAEEILVRSPARITVHAGRKKKVGQGNEIEVTIQSLEGIMVYAIWARLAYQIHL